MSTNFYQTITNGFKLDQNQISDLDVKRKNAAKSVREELGGDTREAIDPLSLHIFPIRRGWGTHCAHSDLSIRIAPPKRGKRHPPHPKKILVFHGHWGGTF